MDAGGSALLDSLARPRPRQQRSQARYDLILDCAEALLLEKGADGFKMSDLSERSSVPFGSLYQYFPDKTAVIATLAGRYNRLGRECVETELTALQTPDDLRPVLGRITKGYYRMFRDHPVMVVIWEATQADRDLQALDAEDGAYLSGLLDKALDRVGPAKDEAARMTFARLVMILIAAAVRDALTMPSEEAERSLALFVELLPDQLA